MPITTKSTARMSKLKKPALWVASVGIALSLIGCGGGSESNSASTQGNTTAYVRNTTPYDIASVRINNQAGEQIAQSPFKCAAGTECVVKTSMDEPGTILFEDKNGAVFAAYILTSKPVGDLHIKTSRYMLGLHAFSELRKRSPQSVTALQSKLARFFTNYNSPDQIPDDMQELGMYYQYRMVGTGLSTEDFYSTLNTRLNKGDILEQNLFTELRSTVLPQLLAGLGNIRLIETAHAVDNPMCAAAMVTFLKAAANAGRVPGISALTELTANVCDETSTTLAEDRLHTITTKADEVNAALHVTGVNVDDLMKFTGNPAATQVLSDLNRNYNTFKTGYLNQYQTLIKGSGSFANYIKQKHNGSLEHAWRNNADVKALIDGLNSQWTNVSVTIGQPAKQTFVDALSASCLGATKSATLDLVQNLANCNGAITNYKAIEIAAHGTLMSVLKDVSDTVVAHQAKEASFIQNNLKAPGTKGYSWAEQYDKEFKPQTRQNLLNSEIDIAPVSVESAGGYFNPTAGLPTELLDNLIKVDCDDSGPTNKYANITSYINNDDKDSYITVLCRNQGQTYASRYYYKLDGNGVTNLMGVVIPANTPTDTAKSHRMYMDNTLYIPKAMPTFTGNIPAGTVAVPNKGNLWEQFILQRDAADPAFRLLEIDWFSIPNKVNVSVRYTKKGAVGNTGDDLSYVWMVNYVTGAADLQVSSSMQCLSKACGYSGDGYRVTFKDYGGPDSIWHLDGKFLDSYDKYSEDKLAYEFRYQIDGEYFTPSDW